MPADLTKTRRFDIALSFPGEHRDFVEKVAGCLAKDFGEERVLYDKYHDSAFARPDLDVYLPNLYRTQSELIVLFLCPEYAAKRWCGLECRYIRQLIGTPDADRIMFLSFGDPGDLSDLGILKGDGYIDIHARSLTPEAVAEKILKRHRLNQGISPPKSPSGAGPVDTFRADISRVIKYAPAELIGRDEETKVLDEAWNQAVSGETKRPHVLTFVALGGEGKTSLVAKWAAELAHQGWPGCDVVFAWSFYSQGTREQLAASSDLFLKEALTFFGDAEMANSAEGAFDKGRRLARLVGERRSLLILDGLEPLQYAPTSPTPGELKDQGLSALLKGLAATSRGLCVVTTRYSIPDLKAFWQTTAPEIELKRLSCDAGVHLLKSMGVKGSERRNVALTNGDPNSEKVNEFEKLVEDVKGHALTLTLLGGFLKRAYHGDIRQRDRVKFEKADEKMDGGHAFRTMAAYEKWLLRGGGDEGRRELAVLRLMGLFDRPADAGCLASLRSEAITGLTEPLAGLADDDWEFCLSGLEAAKLLTVNRDASSALLSLDAHPHLREYFARQLRTQQPDAWRAAHRRLYEHLCETTKEGDEPTLEDLQPLYQAVAHGCEAGMASYAGVDIYKARICRQDYYSRFQLGALASDCQAAEQIHNGLSSDMSLRSVPTKMIHSAQANMLNDVGICMLLMGRLSEAQGVLYKAIRLLENAGQIKDDAFASNLMQALIGLGNLQEAHEFGTSFLAARSTESEEYPTSAIALAIAYEYSGQSERTIQVRSQADNESAPAYAAASLVGWLTLTAPERSAWKRMLKIPADSTKAIEQIARYSRMDYFKDKDNESRRLKDIAEFHLISGRLKLYEHVITFGNLSPLPRDIRGHVEESVALLRRAQAISDLAGALISRSWTQFLDLEINGAHGALADLNEAWEIAERGSMKLHMADIHLYRARLFNSVTPYPWETGDDDKPRGPKDDLAAARKLIEKCGYWRRKEELEDAEAAAKNW